MQLAALYILGFLEIRKMVGKRHKAGRQSLASEKQHQDTKGSRIGSKTNQPTDHDPNRTRFFYS
jgi:hypothetical protein